MGASRQRALRVAVTGNMGSGKSALSRHLADWGAGLVDADQCTRVLLDEDTELQRHLAEAFGPTVVVEGRVDRRELAARAFADEASRQQLDAIIRQPLERRLREALEAAAQHHKVVVFDAPLVFEWGIEDWFDVVVVVTAPAETAHRRLRDRGVSMEQIQARRAAQWDARRQVAAADRVVSNEGSTEQLEQYARTLWADLTATHDAAGER